MIYHFKFYGRYKNCSGTILTAINKIEFQNIPVPLIENGVQQQIAEYIEKSFYLCEESKRLLEEAKDMVEKEIEKGTSKAISAAWQS
ncbi:MAG: hypothetical protein LBR98_08920 [Syntrophomonadaceae bacterium]|jgi:restriction endonuclease S subunit|nr:hypothetical protein [Syntrophomonadaceae bacterium]